MGNVIFISDLMIYSAFVINLGEAVSKGRKYLVVLGGELEGVPSNEQMLTIAHEIAHCYLNHQTFFPDSASIRESEKRDEEDADRLAKHWLNE
jgi:Zn-dependent peptidase ImmA (M78 family)